MSFFLRLKHWQLFLLNFGIPMVVQIIFMVSIFTTLASSPDHNPSVITHYFWFIPIIIVVSMFSLFGWIWTVAITLQEIIPEHFRLKTTLFKVFFIIPVAYIILIIPYFFFVFSGITAGNQPSNGFLVSFFLIFPLHLFSMFCIFYCLYFTAKTIKTAELQRPVTFSDFAGEFFLIWFFFIGVWILQPRINRLASGEIPPQIHPDFSGFGPPSY